MAQRVLVVEDESDLQLLWRAILESAGLEVLEASDGRRGLDLARAEQPDVILLDGHLPDLSGWEVLDELAADPALSAIPVLMVTADTTYEAEARGRMLGAHGYLTKPVRVEVLLDSIRRALG